MKLSPNSVPLRRLGAFVVLFTFSISGYNIQKRLESFVQTLEEPPYLQTPLPAGQTFPTEVKTSCFLGIIRTMAKPLFIEESKTFEGSGERVPPHEGPLHYLKKTSFSSVFPGGCFSVGTKNFFRYLFLSPAAGHHTQS